MWGRILLIYRKILQIMQKKSALFVFLCTMFLFPFTAFSQRGGEFGLLAGGSYYMGDINLYKHMYSPHPNFGAFAKYHLNSRYTLRLGGAYTNLSAADADFNNSFQQLRDRDFEAMLVELSLQFEINFLPYEIGDVRNRSFTPYLQTGIVGYFATSSKDIVNLAIPIGFGAKKNINPRLVLGAEWAFRRTFSDYLDNLSGEDLSNYDPNYGIPVDEASRHKQLGFRYTKDWYSMLSLTLSYTFKLGGLGCPAYYDY